MQPTTHAPAPRRFRARTLLTLLPLAIASPALAQNFIDPDSKFSWSENTGWMNWHDAGSPAGTQGVQIDASGRFLSGFVWCENIGWLNLGNGTPADGVAYANTTGADFGVNVHAVTGNLSGLAWGENVGWVNFGGGGQATPANSARIDTGAQRFRGLAWGENIGWINLDDATRFVALAPIGCDPDYNQDGNADQDDIMYLINVIAGGPNPTGLDPDYTHDGNADQDDVLALINVIAGGACP